MNSYKSKRHYIVASILGIGMLIMPIISEAGWSEPGYINNVYSHNGTYIIQSNIPDEHPSTGAGKYWWAKTDEDATDMYAMALVAFTTDKPIRVVYDPSSPNCLFGGIEITHMNISK